MRRLRTLPFLIAVSLATAIVTATVTVPQPGTGTALAAPALIDAAFRNLPAAVQTGDVLTVEVDVPSGSTCEGSIAYRDGNVQKLSQVAESDRRCRWDEIVPDDTRRGTADIAVTVTRDGSQSGLTATVDVVRRSDAKTIHIDKLPGTVRRNDEFTVRIDVEDGSTCQGHILYDDGRGQGLPAVTEDKERCRWYLAVPADAARGTAEVWIAVTQGSTTTLFASSFEVGKKKEDADLLIGFQDLPGTVRRDAVLPVRVIVPNGATCTGEMKLRGGSTIAFGEATENDGYCRWSVRIPPDAARGEADVKAVVKDNDKSGSIAVTTKVDSNTADVDAAFDELAKSVERGEKLKIDVDVPDKATCVGTVTFDDGQVANLEQQTEKKERCSWSLRVSSSAARGPAIVRVTVTDGTSQIVLTSNVEIESKDSGFKAELSGLPGSVTAGDDFDVKVEVASNSSCFGRITFADGLKWNLGDTDEKNGRCTWDVDLPASVGVGKASIEITVEKANRSTKVEGSFEVTAAQ